MSVLDVMKKTALTGIGLAVMAKDKVEELAKDLAEKADLSEQDGREFVDSMTRSAEEARKDFEERLSQAVREALSRMAVAPRADLDALALRVDCLERRVLGLPPGSGDVAPDAAPLSRDDE